MILNHKKCISEGCDKQPAYNLERKKALYCFTHKLENMIDIKSKRCISEDCNKHSTYNLPTEKKPLYCFEHESAKYDLIYRIKNVKQVNVKNTLYMDLLIKSHTFEQTQTNRDVNLILEQKCSIPECNNEFEFTIDNIKYCLAHAPEKYEINIKKLCKYCDMKDESTHICKDCMKISNKKEWAIVRHLRKNIDTKFEHNSSKMLQGCSKKRPDVYFELNKHCVIVEIDENQHKTYEDVCECARINEIVNGIGGKSVIIIRFNPDKIKHKKKNLEILLSDRVAILVQTIKNELIKQYDEFLVKIIQTIF